MVRRARDRHRECPPLLTAVPTQMLDAPHRYALRFASLAAGVLICWVGPVRAAESAMCRELDHRFDQIRLEISSVQLNSALFSAADTGCEGLARKLLAAGASLEARD